MDGFEVVLGPKTVEPSYEDFPASGDTSGVVRVGEVSSGTLREADDGGRQAGDWFRLEVQSGKKYRVEVDFGSSPTVDTGGAVSVGDNSAWWDHNLDDGRSFVEFRALRSSYFLKIVSEAWWQRPVRYLGSYTVELADISGVREVVANGRAYSGTKSQVGSDVANEDNWAATSFTTGANTGGYRLSWVGSGLHDKAGTNRVKAALYTNSSGDPDAKLFDFERIAQITGAPTAQYYDRFWAPDSAATLDASTTYWVVFKEETTDAEYEVPLADNGTDNPGAAAGWSIGDSTKTYNPDATSPSWLTVSTTRSLVLSINASNVGGI